MMRSYGQICGVAKSLDVIGDRWTLLIVRELLVRGASRYTELRTGLPGIPTNLLADRLRDLEEAGLLRRDLASLSAVYVLTPRGEALEPVIDALGRWGAPLLASTAPDDVLLPHWLVLPARLYLTDNDPSKRAVRIEVRDGHEQVAIKAADGKVSARLGPARKPDAILIGPTLVAWRLLLGKIDVAQARESGLEIEGKAAALKRFGTVGPPKQSKH